MPNHLPELSVIIPTYCRADFIGEAVESMSASGVESMEIIVVDDGSTDDTAEAVARVSPAVVYLKQTNQGPAAARNLGFSHSQGPYVAFVDDDDRWLPGVAPRIISFLNRHPQVDLVFTDAQMGNPHDGFQSWIAVAGQEAFWQLPATTPEPDFRIFEPGPLFARMAVRNPVFIGAVVMRREAFARIGGFNPRLCGAADWELWLRMASQMTFAFCAQPLAIYTRHDQCMSNNHDTMREDFCATLASIRETCSHLDPQQRALVDCQLRHHLANQAYSAFDRGDLNEARRRYRRLSAECELSSRERLLWWASHLPPAWLNIARRARRAMVGT